MIKRIIYLTNRLARKSRQVLQDFFDFSKTKEEKQLERIVKSLPTRSPIFLPTEKIPLQDQINGLLKVKSIYDSSLDAVYRPRLAEIRNKYNDSDRCFVIGNGPSLNKTNLSLLKNEVTFAVNGFFLKAKELDWNPTFYVVEDHLVAEDRQESINAITGSCKLFPAYLAYCINDDEESVFFNHLPRKSYPHGFDFSTDANKQTYTGCTVTFTCLQLAYYFGFKNIYLIGVDSDYAIPAEVKKEQQYSTDVLDMESDDPNHFHPDYFGKGYRWHDPQVHKMIEAYQEANLITKSKGINIYNATIGGKLEVFPRVEYISLFNDK